MMRHFYFFSFSLLAFLSSCSLHKNTAALENQAAIPDTMLYKNVALEAEADNGFVDITTLDKTILIDIRYATKDNFMKEKIYDCGKCYLRPEVAAAVVQVHKNLQKKGLGLKMYDCYRPRPFQQRLWDKMPDDRYVTNPKKGSMHNRGAAVDLTLVDKKGKELDMGTPYDFFGEKAYQTCTDLPKQVLDNRKTLNTAIEAAGFQRIRTEWWHFSYQKKKYVLSDWLWNCK
jgi:zinc D-Ala-D-Ala dipeptidase